MESIPREVSGRPELARDLGASHATAIVVGTIIGSGIFLVPAEMMQAAGSAKLVYLAWLVGGLLSFFGALTYAELGAMKPQAGGEYVYIRDAYGPLPSFLYAWTWFIIAKPASIATLATGFVRVLGTFPALNFLASNFISVPFAVTYGQVLAIAAAVLISVLNYIGIKRAGDFQLVFTLLKVVIILAIVGIGFSYSGGSWQNFAGTFTGAKGGMAGFMAALVAALWAYDGWNDLNMVSGEIRNPERNIPIALIFGVALVGVLYMLVNAAVQYVLPASSIATSPRAASDAMAVVLGSLGAGIVSAGMALSMLGGHERNRHERRTGAVCSGARPVLLLRACRRSSPLSYAVQRDCGASHSCHHPAALWRELSAVLFAGDFCRVAVLHDRKQHGIRVSETRARRFPALSSLGISRGACPLRSGLHGAPLLHIHGKSTFIGIWVSGHSRRRTGFLHFCVAANARRLKVALATPIFSNSSILALPRLLKDTPAGHVYPSLIVP